MPDTVYVVEVDWGTMDGYPDHVHAWAAFSSQEAADAEARQCKDRRPFPAIYAGVVPLILDQEGSHHA